MKNAFLNLNSEEEANLAKAFEVCYTVLASNLPKICGCGRKYETEFEYLQSTKRAGNAVHYPNPEAKPEESMTSGITLFLRNCECHSSISLNLNYEKMSGAEKTNYQNVLNNLSEKAIVDFFKNFSGGKEPGEAQSWKYIQSIGEFREYSHNTQKFLEQIACLELPDAFWKEVGLNIYRDVHNDRVRALEGALTPKYRVLVVNSDKNSLKDLYIPETKIVHRSGLEEGKLGLREAPEKTSAIILDLESKAQEEEYVSWVQAHDSNNKSISKTNNLIKNYTGGQTIPIIRFGNNSKRENQIYVPQGSYNLSKIIQDTIKNN
jgi:hypothetical protein